VVTEEGDLVKFRVRTKQRLEETATQRLLGNEHEAGETSLTKKAVESRLNNLRDVVKEFSNFGPEKEEQIRKQVEDLRQAAVDIGKWSYGSGEGGSKFKAKMKTALVEKYGEFAISLGISNEQDTELNMSPEAKLRRQQMYQREKAEELLEQLSKPKTEQQKPNLTLKKI
jgi:hypothetical protein